MEPTATCRSRSLSLFLAACLTLLAALGLAANGRAATQATPTTIAYTQADGNIVLVAADPDDDSDPTFVTNDWKGDFYPAWSADGGQLLFSRRFVAPGGETGRELFRMNADGSGLQRLTDNDLTETYSALSPNGAQAAFVAGGNLYAIPISATGGGAPVQLTTGGLNPQNLAWSPDSTRLAFNSWPCGNQTWCDEAELYVVTVPGGQLTPLTDNTGYDGDPTWSADSTRLAYESIQNKNPGLYLVAAGGGTPALLAGVTNPDNAEWLDPAWSPDGANIAFIARDSLGYGPTIIRPDGTGRHTFDGSYSNFPRDPAWAADSQALYVRDEDPICGVFGCGGMYVFLYKITVAPVAGTEELNSFSLSDNEVDFAWSAAGVLAYETDGVILAVALTPDATARFLAGPLPVNGDPTWSPDGARLAFSSQRDFNYNIHVADADGNNRVALTTHPGNDWNPTWSAANRIAFTSNRDGNWELYVMAVGDSPDADGSGQTNLTRTPTIAEADAAWSPNGRRLAFARQEAGNWDIYLMNADGSGLTRLTSHAAADRNPTWSPDGARLAFQTSRDGNSDIYVLTVAGPPGNETNLTNTPGDEREPAWSPDGTKVAFGATGLHLMDANGGNPKPLRETGLFPQPAWRPLNLSPRLWLPAVRG